jgi:hypothetical protein
MASFEITGTLKVKGETTQVSEKFTKREFVLTIDQYISLQLTQDKCALLDNFTLGEEMKVSFNLRGREWMNPTKNIMQYFNSLEAWRIEKANATQATAPANNVVAAPQQNGSVMSAEPIADDLPF